MLIDAESMAESERGIFSIGKFQNSELVLKTNPTIFLPNDATNFLRSFKNNQRKLQGSTFDQSTFKKIKYS